MSYNDRGNNDNDFDFENEGKEEEEEEPQKVDNQHFDEAVELDSEGAEEIESDEEDQAEQNRQQQQQAQRQQAAQEEEYSEGGGTEAKVVSFPGAYNPNDYANLNVQQEVKELFKYITRYKPVTVDLDSKLKPFIPEYIPAIGEVDAFLKMERPDEKEETLGLVVLDEPSLNQSNKAKLDLLYKEIFKKPTRDNQVPVHSIERADKNPRAITQWINDVAEIQKKKQPPSVSYSRQMPDIDSLMREWPQEIEDALQSLQLPTAELDVSLQDFAVLATAIMDIPIYPQNPERNIIESLHVLFTLYSEFKSNQHFQQNKDGDQAY